MSRDLSENFPIDIVYLWCDSSDENWCAKKNAELKKYGKILDSDSTSKCRFINNDELKYSLRSLEKYAPWIRNVFIVTDNQVPAWLDTTNPKIKIINHEEILPGNCLPTFNATAIETALFKIPGLSEHFLFANDDMFFGKKVDRSFFFKPNGEPIFRFSKRRIINKKYKHLYGYMISKAYKLVGNSFPYFPHHNIDAYRKSDMEKCYNEFREEFEKTATQKFREKDCVQRSIFGYYSIAKGLGTPKLIDNFTAKISNKFYSKKQDSMMVELTKTKLEKLINNIPYLFCINDSLKTTDEDRLAMRKFLDEEFPSPSEFEKKSLKDAQVYVCYHKDCPQYLNNDAIVPIQVGAEISGIDLGILKDNTGENISAKNKNYCELTALYHLWKNSKAEYVGLMHYRRLFDLSYSDKRWFNGFDEEVLKNSDLTNTAINTILGNYDVILPMKRVIQQSKTVYLYYKKRHYISDLDRVLEIIKSKTPQIYETAIEVLKNSNEIYLYNMFISSKDFLNEYATWLFDILGTLETEIQSDVESRDDFQKRVYGFLSERLFTIYVEYKKQQGLKVKEVPVIYSEANKKRYDKFQTRTKIYKVLTKFGIRKPHWREQYGV